MIPAAELAQIQSDLVAAVCDKACTIQRAPLAADGLGSPARGAYANHGAPTVAGMRQPSAGELQNYAYLIADKAAWTVLLPIGTDVQHQDHLLIEGNTLEVHVTLDPHSVPGLLPVIAAEIK